MAARSFVLPAAVVMAVSLLTACGPTGDDPDDDPSGSAPVSGSASSASEAAAEKTPGADGEYVEASADGPAQNVPKPEKPALADEESYEGAQAFLDYLADARAYAWQTGDTSLIREITAEECESCTEEYDEIDGLYEGGGWASAGRDEINLLDKDMPVNSYGFPAPRAEVGYEGMTKWSSSGDVTEKSPPIEAKENILYIHMEFLDQQWVYVVTTRDPA